jgi:hypothetical protein
MWVSEDPPRATLRVIAGGRADSGAASVLPGAATANG